MAGLNNIYTKTQNFISTKFFANSSARDKSVVKNIGVGFAVKGLSVFLSFLQIPITLSILSKAEYGIWLTLFSIASWLSYFDLGLGNGLKNKLTEALAENDSKKGKRIVSTTYIYLSRIFLVFIIAFMIIGAFVPWTKVLNASFIPDRDLMILVYCCFIFSILNFIANLIQVIFASNHMTGKGNTLVLYTQIIILATTFLIKYFYHGNALLLMGIILSFTPLFVNISASIYFFKTRFKLIAPAIKEFDRTYLKDIMSIGIKFFIIQIAVLIIFSTDNILITQLYAPSEVASYSFVYKYFSLISLSFGIITAPLWTMYTDAYKKNDIPWIENSVKKILQLFFAAVICVLLMTAMSNFILNLWLGKAYTSSILFVFFVGIYTLQTVWNNIFVLPLNGMGKLNLSTALAIGGAVINIPIAIFLSKTMGNVISIVIANILSLIISSVLSCMQFYRQIETMKRQNL